MRLGGSRESGNVEDRRGIGGGGIAIGGGLGTLALVVLGLLFGVDPSRLLNGGAELNQPTTTSRPGGAQGQEDEETRFVRRVLGTTEDVWGEIFRRNGSSYREPRLVLFTQQVQSA